MLASALVRLLDRLAQSSHGPPRMFPRHILSLLRQAVVEDLDAPRAGVASRDDRVGKAVNGEVGAKRMLEREKAVAARPRADGRDGRVGRRSHWRSHEPAVGDLIQEDLRGECKNVNFRRRFGKGVVLHAPCDRVLVARALACCAQVFRRRRRRAGRNGCKGSPTRVRGC